MERRAHRVHEAWSEPRLEAGLPPQAEHVDPTLAAVDARLDPADEPVAEKDRKDASSPNGASSPAKKPSHT